MMTWLKPAITDNMYSIDEAYLFDKSREMSRISIKNQIGYHFQRDVIQEVTQELFITRVLNISSLFEGLRILNETVSYIDDYCKAKTPSRHETSTVSVTTTASKGTYHHVKGTYTQAEARAKCQAMGKQLPEIYTKKEAEGLRAFMKEVEMNFTYAGMALDPVDLVWRHINTGKGSWKGYYQYSVDKDVSSLEFRKDKPEWKQCNPLYFDEGLGTFFSGKLSDGTTPWPYKFDEFFMDGVICQNKWEGSVSQTKGRKKRREISKRSVASTADKADSTEAQMQELCSSLSNQISEFHRDAYKKLSNLLTLIDIDVVMEEQENKEVKRPGGRKKRFIGLLAKLAFRKGTKMLWSLFGFYQQARMRKKIKKNTKDISTLRGQVEDVKTDNLDQSSRIDKNRVSIAEATRLIQENSIAISGLVVAVHNLDERTRELKKHLVLIKSDVDELRDQLLMLSTLMLINSLAARITIAIDNGYEQLSEVVHTSLLGQTSPLVLPIKQMEEVQRKLGDKGIMAVLDKDYSRMKSVVTTDPRDSQNLLIIVNAAAISHKKLELVKLIPIPYYDSAKAYSPSLDYEYVALDQPSNTFTVLSAEEAASCVIGKCYISQMEQSVFSRTCGMPQFFDQALDACDMNSAYHSGLFIQSASPDGVIFSFRGNVTTQMFCNSNKVIKAAMAVRGVGKMFVPPGCAVNAYDSKGQTVKIKGGPSHELIEVSTFDFITETLIVGPDMGQSTAQYPKRQSAEAVMEQKLHVVQESMETATRKVNSLQQKLWITMGCLAGMILITISIVAILYRYSRRFQHRFKKVVGSFVELRDRLLDLDKVKATIALVTPILPGRFRPSAPPRLRVDDTHEYLHLQAQVEENEMNHDRPRRIYDRVPLSRSVNLPPRTPVLPRQASLGNTLGFKNLRVYPDCPKQTSDEDLQEQCASVEELSLVSHRILNEPRTLPDYSSDEEAKEHNRRLDGRR